MEDVEIKRRVSASKRLNKLCGRIDNALLSAEVFWCRAAYGGYERWNYMMHSHSFFEMHFGLGGKMVYEFEDDEYRELSENDFIIIYPGTMHRIVEINEKSSVFKLAFRTEKPLCIMENAEKKSPYYFSGKSDAYVMQSIDFMISQAMDEKCGFEEAIKNQLSAFSIYVLQLLPGVFANFSGVEHCDMDRDDRVRVVKQIIKDNLKTQLKSDDIARQVNISIRHLNRIIKKSDNLNLAELIRRMRIDEAKRLLASTQYSLDEIAEMTGISSVNQLIRVFRMLEGCTPGQYRKDINT